MLDFQPFLFIFSGPFAYTRSVRCLHCCFGLYVPRVFGLPYGYGSPHTAEVFSNVSFSGFLFERSEFLFATCKKNKTDRMCVCPDVRLILVLVLGRQIVYGQNTVYLCLSKCIVLENTQQYKHHVVRSIARSGVSPPGARSDGHHWCQAARTAATCT